MSAEVSDATDAAPEKRAKFCYVGAPAVFALTQACQQINDAFGDFGCYLVGSCLERPDWRDVDVRFIMEDDQFAKLFPDAGDTTWEFDARWLLLTVSISERLSKVTGLPVDFQIQPQWRSTKYFKDQPRQAIWLRTAKSEKASV